jgi:hypothetical protein
MSEVAAMISTQGVGGGGGRHDGGWKAVEVDHDMNDRWWLAGEARRKLVVSAGERREMLVSVDPMTTQGQ